MNQRARAGAGEASDTVVFFKSLLKSIALLLLAGVVIFAGMVLMAFWGEVGRAYKSRLVDTRNDLQQLDIVVKRFNERQHRLPVRLDELADASLVGDDEVIRLPTDPWGGQYFYEVSISAGQPTYQIWAVPDAETQAKLGVARLTLQSDWRSWVP